MQIYFTVSIGPSHLESYMGFSQAPQTPLPSPITPQHPDGASLYFTKEARPLLPPFQKIHNSLFENFSPALEPP